MLTWPAPSAAGSAEGLGGAIELFARLSDGTLTRSWQDMNAQGMAIGWSAWSPVANSSIAGPPSVVGIGGTPQVVALGSDGRIDSSTWQPEPRQWSPSS